MRAVQDLLPLPGWLACSAIAPAFPNAFSPTPAYADTTPPQITTTALMPPYRCRSARGLINQVLLLIGPSDLLTPHCGRLEHRERMQRPHSLKTHAHDCAHLSTQAEAPHEHASNAPDSMHRRLLSWACVHASLQKMLRPLPAPAKPQLQPRLRQRSLPSPHSLHLRALAAA